jgi:glutaredoxin-like protein NrdH
MTKNWLDKSGVPYGVVDLSTDEQALAAVRELGYGSAPVVIVNDNGDTRDEKHWYGFRPDLLAEFTSTSTKAA